MLNLYATLPGGNPVRPDERFHWQALEPTYGGVGYNWLMRRVSWGNIFLPDGSKGYFSSYVLLWFLRWYRGNVKCDGTRTFALANGQLGGDPVDRAGYVMTTTPKEMFSFRLSWSRPDRERYDNMGGI